jgi:hypothetical protein
MVNGEVLPTGAGIETGGYTLRSGSIEGVFRQQFGSSGQPYAIPTELQGGRNLGFMSSCADLIRVSTPLFRALEGVDGRAKPTAVRLSFAGHGAWH